jgi:tRNA pseudouridine38-40 synthase
MRLALAIAYNGANYSGWQFQKHSSTLQEQVEKAISLIANEAVTVTCAGRTDAGVHATGQIIHFDTQAKRDCDQWRMGINANLPAEINVQWVKVVNDEFHARFSAIERRYVYIIYVNKVRPSFLDKQITWLTQQLDVMKMNEAAQCLLGSNDFSAFRASGCQSKTAQRVIKSVNVKKHGEFIILDIKANAFLHHMVRNIVGSLIVIGKGEQSVKWMSALLAGKDRTKAAPTAKPHGLYLVGVDYPSEFNLENKAVMPFYINGL